MSDLDLRKLLCWVDGHEFAHCARLKISSSYTSSVAKTLLLQAREAAGLTQEQVA